MNKVTLIGRLGKDVQAGVTGNGEAWANISLATSEHWKDKDGNKKESTEWHNVVFHARLAEIAKQYLVKGQQVAVVGKLKTRKYEDRNGENRYTTEVHAVELEMLGKPTESTREGAAQPAAVAHGIDDSPEDIPF